VGSLDGQYVHQRTFPAGRKVRQTRPHSFGRPPTKGPRVDGSDAGAKEVFEEQVVEALNQAGMPAIQEDDSSARARLPGEKEQVREEEARREQEKPFPGHIVSEIRGPKGGGG